MLNTLLTMLKAVVRNNSLKLHFFKYKSYYLLDKKSSLFLIFNNITIKKYISLTDIAKLEKPKKIRKVIRINFFFIMNDKKIGIIAKTSVRRY